MQTKTTNYALSKLHCPPKDMNPIEQCLHIAARFGRLELASEIIKLGPKMVWEENEKGETPLYEACRKGHVNLIGLLLETEPWVAARPAERRWRERALCAL
uniref:Uncharacterized protein n=1 Tax=Nelumbo nucifera TaxID=4432 RepID=A0A822Y338_NELNU|nr:TPA_asm: hypothetical protein HUJ06_028315 [Nelumbo nucifera]